MAATILREIVRRRRYEHIKKKAVAAQREAWEPDPGWYVAFRSKVLRHGDTAPRPVFMFGRRMVAFRDDSGAPVVMDNFCVHQGASLSQGKVVSVNGSGSCLRCPFHEWSFDAKGKCFDIPAITHPIPGTARQRTYPATERHGYIWVWYGEGAPLYDVPSVQAPGEPNDGHSRWHMSFLTRTSVQHIIENNLDYRHTITTHKVPAHAIAVSRREPSPAIPVPERFWYGAEIDLGLDAFVGLAGKVAPKLGIHFDRLRIVGDFFPGGNVLRYYFNDETDFSFQVLAATTPVTEDMTQLHILMRISNTGSKWRDLLNLGLYGMQCEVSSYADLAIWNDPAPRHARKPGVFVEQDREMLDMRRHAVRWRALALAEAKGHTPAEVASAS